MSTIAASAAASPAPAQAASMSASGAATAQAQAPKKHQGFGFADLIDIINPLQHIPIISTIYRKITGDEIGAVAKVAGGALYGGLIGMGLSVADVAVEEITGEDAGDHVMDMLGIKSHDGKEKETAVADAASSGSAPSASAQAAPLPVIAPATSEADARTWFPAHAAGSVRTAALSAPIASAAKPAPDPAAAAAVQAAPEAKAVEPAPSAAPVANAAAEATASVAPAVARPAAAQPAPASGSVPQMDQATFDALMRTLNNGKSIATVGAGGTEAERRKDRAQAADPTPAPAQPAAAPGQAVKSYDDALKAMNAALDRYQAAGGHIPPVVTVPRYVPAAPQAQ